MTKEFTSLPVTCGVSLRRTSRSRLPPACASSNRTREAMATAPARRRSMRSRERLVLRKLATQVTGNDVDSFVMEAAAQIGFALDVDQSRFSKCRRRGDPHRFAERVSANFQDAQPVHLADA